MDQEQLYKGLNPGQLKAVKKTEGPVLIIAGAGAGKTKTLTLRVAELIKNGVSPNKILAITFTNKAAGEMKERIGQTLKQHLNLSPYILYNQQGPFIGTFHALGLHLIRSHRDHFDLPVRFSILDRGDSKKVIREALKDSGLDPKAFDAGKILSVISRYKSDGLTSEKLEASTTGSALDQILPTVWHRYEQILTSDKALDFDDLLLKPVKLLESSAKIRQLWQNRWQYLHIDEYQDTNQIQYKLAHILSEEHQNLCVVGDPDQTIYTFRGAKIENILRFEEDHPQAEVITLNQNYRSTQTILNAANGVIANNIQRKEKNLFTKNKDGLKIDILTGLNEQLEAKRVVEFVQDQINNETLAKNIGILYRANFQSRALEEALISARVNYLLTGTKFFERKEIKDIMAYIRAALAKDLSFDHKRVLNEPPRGLGKVSILKILSNQADTLTGKARIGYRQFEKLLSDIALGAEKLKPSDLVKLVIKDSGLERYWQKQNMTDQLENAYELAALASRFDDSPSGFDDFLDHVDLYSDQDSLDQKRDGVRLMTVHAAKGLEFDCVVITGLEDGLFPHTDDNSDMQKQEEERRLFYVAMTRARHRLALAYAHSRMVFGSQQYNQPSEFLNEIDPELITEEEVSVEPLYRIELL